CQQGVNFPLTF
nr:immunoglobulin light chain junction region [Macaca mulatta]MOV86331.1 immunoglobulin light chain junction region [Macaca mulatta]